MILPRHREMIGGLVYAIYYLARAEKVWREEGVRGWPERGGGRRYHLQRVRSADRRLASLGPYQTSENSAESGSSSREPMTP